MKLSADIEFREDVRLLIYRPKGLINEAEINRVIGVIEGIEAASQQPSIDFLIRRKPTKLSSTSSTSFKLLFTDASPMQVVSQ